MAEVKYININGLTLDLVPTHGVTDVVYNPTMKKLAMSRDDENIDIVTVATLKSDMELVKADVGLGNVENKSSATIRGEITNNNVVSALGYTPAELDGNGIIVSSQLPSFVDDVLEYSSRSAFPATGESGKIYVALDTNLTYRWGGSEYVEISKSLALGETSTTAYRGDRGKTAYDHATDAGKISTAQESGLYKVAVTSHGHIASVSAVTKTDITNLGIPAQDTTYDTITNSQIDALFA